MFQAIKEWRALRQWKKSIIGVALHRHGYDNFFASDAPFSYMDEAVKVRHCAELHAQVSNALSAENSLIAVRELLAEYVHAFAQLMVVGMPEQGKEDRGYADTPYISGQLRPYISQIAGHIDELGLLKFEQPDVSDEELADYCTNRASLMLFYSNGVNIVSIAIDNRSSRPSEWYRAFIEARLVADEDKIRQDIGLKSLLPGPVDGLTYSAFTDMVINGQADPFFAWVKAFPDKFLHGRGPAPQLDSDDSSPNSG